jgi:ketopantoate reductase
MRYVIVGAGALGGCIGAKLAASGQDVALVARGAHLAALQVRWSAGHPNIYMRVQLVQNATPRPDCCYAAQYF